jgi:hypothetical protein
MPTSEQRIKRLALLSRLTATFPEDPEWPFADQVSSEHFWPI